MPQVICAQVMPIERHRSPVAIRAIPRGAINHVHHGEIDAVLKDMRICSRRLKSALDTFNDELRTLERLYYKCKNQHRPTLFFKRVLEIRCYGRRVSEQDIVGRVDLLRASFVGLENTDDHKALRNCWSRVPEKPYVCILIERLAACRALVCKMRVRLEKAYHHFALAMQTGAFVQLIILFVAISCRMSMLLFQLEEVLHVCISACNRLLVIIDSIDQHALTSLQVTLEQDISRSTHSIDHDLVPEDTGQLVSGGEPIDISTISIEEQNIKVEAPLQTRVTLPLPTSEHIAPRVSKKLSTEVVQKSRTKKTRKKIDEIDEIFGF